MTKSLVAALLICLLFSVPVPASAQEQYTEGSVSRVLLLRVTPGKLESFLTDLRQNLKPLYEQEKQQGLISDYKIYLNSTKDGPDDWDLAIQIEYKNMAALDGLTAKIQALTLKQYGSKEARQTAFEKRVELAHLVGNRLMREIELK